MSDIRLDLDRWKRIEQIGVCASKDPARPILTSVYVEPGDGSLTITATDSYRLATTKIEADCELSDPFLFPAKTAKDIRLAVSKVAELGKNPEVHLKVTKLKAKVAALNGDETPRFIQTVQLIDGKFPHYSVLFPTDSEAANASFNAEYVSSMAVAANAKDHYPVEFRVRGPLEPVLLTSPADREFRGLVMPVRI